ncbi:MAG: hypothetical protein LBD79_08900 [Treponema sp.]|jgi:hypothetical protein|nr:hypothetical protein [Treponema sp.]
MPKILTHLQHDVIAYILASNEEREPPINRATPYMRAFEGGFFSDMPFTLFLPTLNRVILYVAEEGASDWADRREFFNKRCEALKKPLLDTADFIVELVNHDYLRVIPKTSKVELHANYGTRWRRYEAFYASESDALRFVCSAWLVPKRKLYRFENPQLVKQRKGYNNSEDK